MLVSTKSRTVQMIGSSCSGANGGAWSGATIAIGSPVRWDRYTARICRFCVGARTCMPNGNASIAAAAGTRRRVTRSSIRVQSFPGGHDGGRGSIRLGQPDLSRPVRGRGKPQGSEWILGLMASRPVLYSMDISHYCIAADRMLAFKGVDFDTRYAPYHDRQEVLKATGQDYVPTLIWEGKPLMWYDLPNLLENVLPN